MQNFYITDYVGELMDLIFEKVSEDPVPFEAEVRKIPIPDSFSTQFEKPDKMEVIASCVSRFNQGLVWIQYTLLSVREFLPNT